MKAYVFQAALLCEDCGKATCDQLRVSIKNLHPEFDESNEYTFDSDYFPKGPYSDGGGEADCPQHCDHCRVFLQNPLTGDGVAYVREQVSNSMLSSRPSPIVAAWREFYGVEVEE